MQRKAFFLREDQVDFLETLPGMASEHLRQAIDDYKLKFFSTSSSESKRKEANGRSNKE